MPDAKMYERCCHYRKLMFGKHDKAIRYIAVVFVIIVITLENLGKEQVNVRGFGIHTHTHTYTYRSQLELCKVIDRVNFDQCIQECQYKFAPTDCELPVRNELHYNTSQYSTVQYKNSTRVIK